jgi:hypothetical protein
MPTKIASAKKLIINKLTQAQYDSIPEKDPAQLYLITDAEVSGGTSGFTKEEADLFYVSKDESGAAMFDTISRTQGQITVPNKPGTLALLSDLEGLPVGEGVIIPSQENNSGKFLTTDGNNLSWAEVTASNTNIQVTEMPEATEENFGMIVQYVGESTEQYIKGCFYENSICYNTSIEHEIANPSGYRDIDVVLDIGVFSEVVNDIPGTYTFAEEGMEASRIALYNESGEVILAIETPDVEDFADFGIIDFVHSSGQSAMGPGIVGIRVNITLDKSIGHMWSMVNVQPVFDPIPSQEGNAGKILSTDGSTAMWIDAPSYNVTGGLTQEQADALYMKKSENGGVELGETTLIDRVGDFRIHTTGDESTGIHITGHGAVYPENPNNQDATLGRSDSKWIKTYTQTLNNGEDIQVPNKAGTLALLSDLEGLSGGEGVSLPDQTGNAGNFLYTDGNNLSWANALKNNAKDIEEYGSVAIGGGATCEGGGVCIGQGSDCRNGVAIGNYTYSTASEAIAIGLGANATAGGAIQIGFGTNSEANTFSVGLGSTPYKMLGADGVIPSERLASDGATGQVLTKTASGMEWATISSGDASGGLTQEQADLLYAKKDDTGAVEIKEIYNSEGYHIAIPDQGNLAADDSSTYAATTAWVQRAIDSKLSGIESILDELNGETLEG